MNSFTGAKMTHVQSDMFAAGAEPPTADGCARLREHQADLTPRGVARQALEWLDEGVVAIRQAKHILCPNAGDGCYVAELRRLAPQARITAVEVREECRANLERWADEVIIGDAREVLGGCLRAHGPGYDVIADNPSFALIGPLINLLRPMLARAGVLVLLGLTQWGQAADHWTGAGEWLGWSRWPPDWQLRVGGRVQFRNGRNPKTGKTWTADAREYSHFCWGQEVPSTGGFQATKTVQMRPLPGHFRRWSVRPGTETQEDIDTFELAWQDWREETDPPRDPSRPLDPHGGRFGSIKQQRRRARKKAS